MKTTSIRKRESNRRNALKSTGPRTEAGKKRVSVNAVRHGITADKVIPLVWDRAEAERLALALQECFRPVGFMEEFLLGEIYRCIYRLRRAADAEVGSIFTHDAVWFGCVESARAQDPPSEDPVVHLRKRLTEKYLIDSKASLPRPEDLENILRYEAAADRRLKRYLDELFRLQAKRKKI